jgi:hypothetical protein
MAFPGRTDLCFGMYGLTRGIRILPLCGANAVVLVDQVEWHCPHFS